MFESAAKPIFRSGASVPPATTTSASPRWIMRSPSRKQMTLDAQAATCVMTGPVKPYSMETWQAAIEPDRAGIAKGLTKRAPFVLMVSWPFDDLLHAAAGGVHGHRHPVALLRAPGREESRRASAMASLAAAMPRWMKRLMRRAILGFMATAGSKSLTSAAMRTSRSEASKLRDGPAAAHAGHRVGPERGVVVADGRDGAQAGHDGTT